MKSIHGVCALLPLIAGACASTHADHRFPTRASLADLAARPLPEREARPDPATVATWTLAGPFPDRFGDTTPAIGLAGTIVERAAPGRSSDALSCAARELARFVMQHDQRPEPLLEAFLLQRCGSSASTVAYFKVAWTDLPAGDTDDARLLDHADVTGWLKNTAASLDGARLGLALVRDDAARSATVMASAATPAAKIDATPQRPATTPGAAPTVAVSGTIVAFGDLVAVQALATQGAVDVASCTAQGVPLPRFSFVCPVAADDDTAHISIAAWERDRVLGRAVADVMALPDGSDHAGHTYQRATYLPPTPMPPIDGVGGALLAATNGIRAQRGLGALSPAPEQDGFGRSLAGRFFLGGDDDAKAHDMIALGLLAGWEVKGTIIGDGDFNADVAYGDGLDAVLASLMASPSTRGQLMSKESTVASIAAHQVGSGVGLLISTYEPLLKPDAQTGTAVFESLRAARRARGVSDLMILPVGGAELRAVEMIHKGSEPEQVFRTALREAVDARGNGLQGFIVQTQDVTRIPWPDALLSARSTSVAVAVASYKHKEAAWGSLTVIVIAEVDKDVQVASSGAGSVR